MRHIGLVLADRPSRAWEGGWGRRAIRASLQRVRAVRSAWPRWLRYDFLGLTGAVACFCLSLAPSLLPRGWPLQGVIGGIAGVTGYGVGVLVWWLVRLILRRPPAPAVRRVAWRSLALPGPAVVAVFLYAGERWQREIRELMGEPPRPRYHAIMILVLSSLIVAGVVAASRLLRRITQWTTRQLARLVPARVAVVLGLVCVALVAVVIVRIVLYGGLLAAANAAFSRINAETSPGSEPPANPALAGSHASLIPWATLGNTGRQFVSTAPTVAQLEAFSGRPARSPIRVYAGLASAPTLEAKAALAVNELDRAGAFRRKVLLVVTSTGTGWVDGAAVAALEYMYNGDTATVSMQYSYLPSGISFISDRQRADQAGRVLFNQVHDRWRRLPRAERPALLVFGESLGAFGSQAAFSDIQDVVGRTDGALWEGPPNSSRLWQMLTRHRQPGTPEVLPVYGQGQTVRFAATPSDLASPSTPWKRPRVVYLQHASDPVVWWSVDLIFQEPDWLRERRGRDVSPAMRWYPLVTFLQVSADLLRSTRAPDGHGHDYHVEPAGAWARIAPPPDWTAADSGRLEGVLAGMPRPPK